jgi:hypothetical protein
MLPIPALGTNTCSILALAMFWAPRITWQQVAAVTSPSSVTLTSPLVTVSMRPTVQAAQGWSLKYNKCLSITEKLFRNCELDPWNCWQDFKAVQWQLLLWRAMTYYQAISSVKMFKSISETISVSISRGRCGDVLHLYSLLVSRVEATRIAKIIFCGYKYNS